MNSRSPHVALRSALLAVASLALLALPAFAAAPANVTVRVEGLTHTLLPATPVTTTTAPVQKDGEHSCPGTSAAGALQDATAGNWSGPWFEGLGYSAEAIEGESYAFNPASNANYYWTLWVDGHEASTGLCGTELSDGESVLLFVECFGSECPTPGNPLSIQLPASASVGEPVTVTVDSLHNPDGAVTPAIGASVVGGGVIASTDANGHATMAFAGAGTYTLQATLSEPHSIRAEATICVHEGNDGSCGTTAPSQSPLIAAPQSSAGTAPAVYRGPYAVVAQTTGLSEGHVYSHGHAPRLLSGQVIAHTSVSSVSVELRRSWHGRCYAYDGTSERFRAARCGTGRPFQVASGPSFSYLLPKALPRGRYVLDLHATDTAGNVTTLARGSSRIVFYVH
jgi:hypothetical protein